MANDETVSADTQVALSGTLLAGRYRVGQLLGSGGMGSVYLAEHVLMKKTVAVKVLHREMTRLAEVVARFEREAVAAARIDHPNVASAIDFGRLEDGSLFLVLEYVDGKGLRTVIEQGPLSVERTLGIARQIADAVVAAHAVGIVHRDLKPENVLLVNTADGSDHVKVLDFGIAKVLDVGEAEDGDRKLTRIGAIMGTMGYMAPEQALGQKVDARADLYSFGVVLYEMLTARLPFFADDFSQILAKQLTEPPPPLPDAVPKPIAEVIERLLKPAAEERCTAEELRATLADCSAPGSRTSSPIQAAFAAASPDPVPPPARKGARTGVIAGALAALCAVGLFAWKAGLLEAVGSPAAAASSGPRLSAGGRPTSAPAASDERAASASPVSSGASPAESATGLEPGASADPNPSASPAAAGAPPRHPSAAESASSSNETTTRKNGRTVTRRTSTRTSSESSSRVVTKRRTGPGGIYIPPPSQWFK